VFTCRYAIKITINKPNTGGGFDFSFRSPPEGYKASTRSIHRIVAQHRILENDPHQRTLAQFSSEHSESRTFDGSTTPIVRNTYMNRMSYEFRTIVENYLQECIHLYTLHFVLNYKSENGKQMLQDLYLKNTFFTVGPNSLNALKEIIAFSLQISSEEVETIIFEDLADFAELGTKSLTNQRAINCTVHTKRERALKLQNTVLVQDFD
jgi:hypothetical protein